MKIDRKNFQKGLKLFNYLEADNVSDFSKWLRKHKSSRQVHGINEGCGPNKCSVLMKAVTIPRVKWEDYLLLIDRLVVYITSYNSVVVCRTLKVPR